ncbi:hypothetical protein GEV01_18575 [Rugamonas sp. FT103W]|uniref:Uncharacterized protein n=1 Tax=Rugamonas rivuli TaxID=2743358 RepID=A0A843SHD6_9BURK|nr:hypothetical protein [Rugamonas rivuli]
MPKLLNWLRHRRPSSNHSFEGFNMRQNTSPLEHLTAFAIVFAAGILTAASFVAYMEQVRRNAVRDHLKRMKSGLDLSDFTHDNRSAAE